MPALKRSQNSQERLAHSIADSIRLWVRKRQQPGSKQQTGPQSGLGELPVSVEHALDTEARRNELYLAYVRVVSVLAYAVTALLVNLRPETTGGSARGAVVGALLAGAWSVMSAVLLAALHRGWYRRWLRIAIPVADALVIGAAFFLIWRGLDYRGDALEPGAVSVLTALCVFLGFSGALRLSPSAVRLSAALAVALYLWIAVAADVGAVQIALVAGMLLATGALGSRVANLVRRVVTNELGRGVMERMYEEARQSVEAREEVLKIVSHDLRNPLGTIAMSTQFLLEEPGLPEAMRVKQLKAIKRAGERMNRLIQDLLNVARMEAGRLVVEPRRIEVSAIVAEALEQLRPLAADKGIVLSGEAVPDETGAPLPAVHADVDRVLQVISNLVGNAIKFTPSGGRVTIRAERAFGLAEKVRLSVSDTGSGIPPDQLPHIFGRFWQANKADRRGIGLGLAIAKGIVEAHGETIWVESRVGEGTTFYFTLPEAPEPAVSADMAALLTTAERRSGGDRRQSTTTSGQRVGTAAQRKAPGGAAGN